MPPVHLYRGKPPALRSDGSMPGCQQILRPQGVKRRTRHHGGLARIQVPAPRHVRRPSALVSHSTGLQIPRKGKGARPPILPVKQHPPCPESTALQLPPMSRRTHRWHLPCTPLLHQDSTSQSLTASFSV
jgi:hypothetical protein